jgi:hypothetical protein
VGRAKVKVLPDTCQPSWARIRHPQTIRLRISIDPSKYYVNLNLDGRDRYASTSPTNLTLGARPSNRAGVIFQSFSADAENGYRHHANRYKSGNDEIVESRLNYEFLKQPRLSGQGLPIG